MKTWDKGLAGLMSLAVLTVVLAAGSALAPKGPGHKAVAAVVGTYVTDGRFPRTVIIAHAPNAIDAHGVFREGDDEDCRVGDVVIGTPTGITLKIDPYSCSRPQALADKHK